jgi:hypothetical protein
VPEVCGWGNAYGLPCTPGWFGGFRMEGDAGSAYRDCQLDESYRAYVQECAARLSGVSEVFSLTDGEEQSSD